MQRQSRNSAIRLHRPGFWGWVPFELGGTSRWNDHSRIARVIVSVSAVAQVHVAARGCCSAVTILDARRTVGNTKGALDAASGGIAFASKTVLARGYGIRAVVDIIATDVVVSFIVAEITRIESHSRVGTTSVCHDRTVGQVLDAAAKGAQNNGTRAIVASGVGVIKETGCATGVATRGSIDASNSSLDTTARGGATFGPLVLATADRIPGVITQIGLVARTNSGGHAFVVDAVVVVACAGRGVVAEGTLETSIKLFLFRRARSIISWGSPWNAFGRAIAVELADV